MIEPKDDFERVMLEMMAKGLPQEIVLKTIEEHRDVLRFLDEVMKGEGSAIAKQKFKQGVEEADRKFQETMIKAGKILLNKFQEIRSRMN